MKRAFFPTLLLLSGCCGQDAPVWLPIEPLALAVDVRQTVDLRGFLVDDGGELTFTAVADPGVLASVDEAGVLTVVSESGFTGSTAVHVTVADACGNASDAELDVIVGGASGDVCLQHLEYTARAGAQQVFVAGEFNDWDPTATPMTDEGGGLWSVDLDLAKGNYAYKFIEVDYSANSELWSCDPEADFVQCDEGYTWDPSCAPGGAECNSLLVVPDCSLPQLDVTALHIDRDANGVAVVVDASGDVATAAAMLDGAPVDAWTGSGFSFAASGLSEGRHVLQFSVTTSDGRTPRPLKIPFWTDDVQWQNGLLYYVFVDRFFDGAPELNRVEGTFGEDADLTSNMIREIVLGFQGTKLGTQSVAMTTKHFPGGGPQVDGQDSHFDWGKFAHYPGGMFDFHVKPFKAAIAAGTSAIMPYYSAPKGKEFEEVGFSYNKAMIEDLLQKKLGFHGIINSDTGPIEMMPWGVENLSLHARYQKALNAGVDIFSGAADPTILLETVKKGLISEARINVSVAKLLTEKFDLGLFENPYVSVDEAVNTIGKKEFKELGAFGEIRYGIKKSRNSICLS